MKFLSSNGTTLCLHVFIWDASSPYVKRSAYLIVRSPSSLEASFSQTPASHEVRSSIPLHRRGGGHDDGERGVGVALDALGHAACRFDGAVANEYYYYYY